jgi:hypothetical protein
LLHLLCARIRQAVVLFNISSSLCFYLCTQVFIKYMWREYLIRFPCLEILMHGFSFVSLFCAFKLNDSNCHWNTIVRTRWNRIIIFAVAWKRTLERKWRHSFKIINVANYFWLDRYVKIVFAIWNRVNKLKFWYKGYWMSVSSILNLLNELNKIISCEPLMSSIPNLKTVKREKE